MTHIKHWSTTVRLAQCPPQPLPTALPTQRGNIQQPAILAVPSSAKCGQTGAGAAGGVALEDPCPHCTNEPRSTGCSQLPDTSWEAHHCFTLHKKHALRRLVTDSQHHELGAFFSANMMLYHYVCSQGTTAWGKQENISPLRAGPFSNWDKRRVVLGESQAEWIAGQGRSFSPLKSLQNPIGKTELHHWEINILILRTAVTETVQDTGSGHWDLAHIPYIPLCLSQKHQWTFCLAWPKAIMPY